MADSKFAGVLLFVVVAVFVLALYFVDMAFVAMVIDLLVVAGKMLDTIDVFVVFAVMVACIDFQQPFQVLQVFHAVMDVFGIGFVFVGKMLN